MEHGRGLIGSWIAARNRRKVRGVVQPFAVAFSDFGVAQFIKAHLIEVPEIRKELSKCSAGVTIFKHLD